MVRILLAIAVGIVIGGPITFFLVDNVGVHNIDTLWIGLIALTVLAGVALAAALVFLTPAIKLILGPTIGTLSAVSQNLLAAAQANKAGQQADAVVAAATAANEAAAWYTNHMARRAITASLIAIAALFGGSIGSVLLYRQYLQSKEQTRLLELQNTKLDIQIHLSESARRASFLPEISAVQDALEKERKAWLPESEAAERAWAPVVGRFRHCSTKPDKRKLIISEELGRRISNLNTTLRPYLHVEYDVSTGARAKQNKQSKLQLSDRLRSPERGQLLRAILLANAYLPYVGLFTNFDDADMRNANVVDADFCSFRGWGIDFTGAHIQRSHLAAADMRYASFDGAMISGSDFMSPFGGAEISMRSTGFSSTMICVPFGEPFFGVDLTGVTFAEITPCAGEKGEDLLKALGKNPTFAKDKFEVIVLPCPSGKCDVVQGPS